MEVARFSAITDRVRTAGQTTRVTTSKSGQVYYRLSSIYWTCGASRGKKERLDTAVCVFAYITIGVMCWLSAVEFLKHFPDHRDGSCAQVLVEKQVAVREIRLFPTLKRAAHRQSAVGRSPANLDYSLPHCGGTITSRQHEPLLEDAKSEP